MPSQIAKVTATDANREFSKVLERVIDGEVIVITKNGKVVATINPATEAKLDAEADDARREAARQSLKKRLLSQKPLNLGKFDRNELYDEALDESSN